MKCNKITSGSLDFSGSSFLARSSFIWDIFKPVWETMKQSKMTPHEGWRSPFCIFTKRSEMHFNNFYSECPSLRKIGMEITSLIAHFTFVWPVSTTTTSTFLPFSVAPSSKITLSCYISAFLSWVSSPQTMDYLYLPLPLPPPLAHRVPGVYAPYMGIKSWG